jgi:hypothetical protein
MSIEEKLTNAEAYHLAIDAAQVHILDKDSDTRRLYTLGGLEAANTWAGNQTFSGDATFSGDLFNDSPGAPSRPTTAAELNTAISGGSKYVTLKYITTIDVDVRIPYDVAWEPPNNGSPLTFSVGAELRIDGPPASAISWKIFDSTTLAQVGGHFGGYDINVGWWSGFDPSAVADFGPHLEVAARARNIESGSATLLEWNDIITDFTLNLGSDATGGKVIIPAGVWTITSTVTLSGKYVQIEGITQGTGLRFNNVASGPGISIINAAANLHFKKLQIFIESNCHINFDLFKINSGFMEGVIFEYLIIRGCKRYLWNLDESSSSTNHFTIRLCHILGPHEDASTCVYGRSLNNRFVWDRITLAKSGGGDGYWDIGLDLSGYDRVSVENSHFEAIRTACVRVSDKRNTSTRYNGTVTMRNITHNYNGAFWDLSGGGSNAWLLSEATSVAVDVFRTHNTFAYRCILAHTPNTVGATGEPGVGGTWTTYWDLDDGGAILYCHKDGAAAAAPSYGIVAEGLTTVEGFLLIKDDAFLGTVREGGNTDLDSNGECRQLKNSPRRVSSYVRTLDSYSLQTTNPTSDVATSGVHSSNVTDDIVALDPGFYEVVPSGSFGGGTLTIETADQIVQPGFSAITSTNTRTIFHPGSYALVTLAGSTSPSLTVTFTRVHNL